jgi:hypothetical protein
MTTIAYRDGVLAADRRAMIGDWVTVGRVSKIARGPDGSLFAATGDLAVAARFRRWVEGGRAGDAPETGRDSRCIVVEPDGRVLVFESDTFFVGDGPFHAWGSGFPAALAAMHMGASAARAIEIAALLDPATGGGVDVLLLDGVGALAEVLAAAE